MNTAATVLCNGFQSNKAKFMVKRILHNIQNAHIRNIRLWRNYQISRVADRK